MKVVLLDGSPAVPSRVGVLIEAIAAQLHEKGCETVVLELQSLALPTNDPAYYKNPREHPDERVRDFVAAIQDADAVVLGTPLYHGSYSGLIKSALDHLTNDALRGKVVGIISNATGPRSSVLAASALVPVARALKGEVINCLIGTCKADYAERGGVFQIVDECILERIDRFASELTKQ